MRLALALLLALPAFGVEVEEVSLEGTAASYYDPGEPGPGALLLHQCDSDRTSWDGFARDLAAAGFHVVTMDFPGYGDSAGERYSGDGNRSERMAWWREDWTDDVERAHRFLVERPGIDPYRLVTAGASCGGMMAVDMTERFPSSYRALALLSAPLDKRNYDHLFHSSIPVLAAVSGDDTPYTQYAHQQVDRSTNEASEFVLLEKAGHGTEMLANDEALRARLIAWFERWAGTPPSAELPPPAPEVRRSDG